MFLGPSKSANLKIMFSITYRTSNVKADTSIKAVDYLEHFHIIEKCQGQLAYPKNAGNQKTFRENKPTLIDLSK